MVSDVSRKVVPDKGSQNRERPVTKAESFHLAQERVCFCFFRYLNWSGECD